MQRVRADVHARRDRERRRVDLRDRAGLLRDPERRLDPASPSRARSSFSEPTTLFVAGLIFRSALPSRSPTQTAPNAKTRPFGSVPALIVFTTLFVFGLMRETVPLERFATQSEPPPNARS